ncbi:MAG: glycosyltransferase family 39 protein [Bacteroidota bacterium]
MILILGLIAWRFLHFGPELDLPHDWRQADTAYYIYDFYKNGIDLLQPAVCWMGAADTVILEFPLPEAIVAQLQRWFGESMWLCRAIFLLFFLLCTYYFYRIVELLFDKQTALWAAVIYLALPLAQFYSRAIHIDFFAQAFAYATFYYTLAACHKRSSFLLVAAAACATIAILVKVPYLFYLAIPVLVYAFHHRLLQWLVLHSLVFLPAVLIFLLWQKHVYATNAAAPDWDYILHYRKFDQNASWYFGVIEQRLSLYHWKEIGLRVLVEAGGVFAVLLLPFWWKSQGKTIGFTVLLSWVGSLGIYVILFFNLNAFHNYYQIPFLGPIAIFVALALLSMKQRWGATVQISIAIGVISLCTAYAEWNYYQTPTELDEVADKIQELVPPEGLPVVVYKKFDCRNPRILARARRRGWSLQEAAASPEVVKRLHEEEGATHLIVVENNILASELLTSFKLNEIQQIAADTLPASRLSLVLFQFLE